VSSPDRTATLLESALPRAAITRRPADDLLGEIPVAAPDSAEQWSEVLRLAGRERLCVLPLGLGSKLGWLRTPERLDLALSSARFHGVSAFEAADGTITARAGTTLAALSEAVSATHHLSPEIALPRASTLGGVLAAGTSGLDRLRHGPVRHQVLGITVALADGSLVKSGGRVVKNVTGYDLHRLWCGSSGTLCVLLETTLRLYPRPAREAVLEARFADRAGALERARALVRSAVQPVAVVVEEQGSEWRLSLVLSGRDEIVAHDVDEMRRGLPGSVLHEGADAQRARADCATGSVRTARGRRWRSPAGRRVSRASSNDSTPRSPAAVSAPRSASSRSLRMSTSGSKVRASAGSSSTASSTATRSAGGALRRPS
jgi:glycolate oxidase FAD binding subunit